MALRTPINVPLSVEHLQSIWQELNESYFQNRLPAIEIQWSTRLTASAGLFRSRTGPRTSWVALEERHGKGRVIRLSVPLLSGQSFEEIRGTLAHEMIHQWQFDVKKWCPSHGREFRRIMALMNAGGLGITIYHTLAEETQASAKLRGIVRGAGTRIIANETPSQRNGIAVGCAGGLFRKCPGLLPGYVPLKRRLEIDPSSRVALFNWPLIFERRRWWRGRGPSLFSPGVEEGEAF